MWQQVGSMRIRCGAVISVKTDGNQEDWGCDLTRTKFFPFDDILQISNVGKITIRDGIYPKSGKLHSSILF